jgi:hypothetical protein
MSLTRAIATRTQSPSKAQPSNDPEDAGDSDELNESDDGTDPPPGQAQQTSRLQGRVIRNNDRAKVFDDVQHREAGDLENFGPVNRHDVLDKIILVARQDQHLCKFFEGVDDLRLKEMLENAFSFC